MGLGLVSDLPITQGPGEGLPERPGSLVEAGGREFIGLRHVMGAESQVVDGEKRGKIAVVVFRQRGVVDAVELGRV